MSLAERLDPGHVAHKKLLQARARRAMMIGLGAALLGTIVFIAAPLDAVGFIAAGAGMLLSSCGWVTTMIGAVVWLYAHSGDIARFTAAEQVPLAVDVARELAVDVARELAPVRAEFIRAVAPAQADAAREIVREASRGWREGNDSA